MSTQPSPSRSTTHPAALGHLVCGVDATRSSAVAVEQAVALARPGGAVLTFVAVTDVRGAGPNEMASLDPKLGGRALEAARRAAHDAGLQAETEIVHARDAAAALEERAAGSDLLLVGAPVGSRAAGIFLGTTATRLLHRSQVPVLVARRPPDDTSFPEQLLVATDGSPGSDRAVELGAAIATTHGSEVALVHAGATAGDRERRRMAEQAVSLREATGVEAVSLAPSGSPAEAIVHAATWVRAALVIVGSRGATGARALGSVSERVAHRAPCSVLVARGA